MTNSQAVVIFLFDFWITNIAFLICLFHFGFQGYVKPKALIRAEMGVVISGKRWCMGLMIMVIIDFFS